MPGVPVTVYGEAASPHAPEAWDRSIWWALNRAARVGAATGRNRWRLRPPFRYEGLLVTAGRPGMPWGRSTAPRSHWTHVPHTVLFAWRGGVLVGRMVAWWCSARTAHFRFVEEPDSPPCQLCLFRLRSTVEA